MKKNYYYSVLLLLFISANVCSQVNDKIKENASFQKTLKFDNGLPMDAAISAFTKAYKLGKGNSFEAKKATIDKTNMSHQRHQQFYNGIKVEFGMLITHTLNGKVVSVNGELYNVDGLNLTPTLSKSEGLTRAISSTNAQKFLWEDVVSSNNMDYKKPEGELVVFPIVKTGEVKLAYKYDVYATQPISRNEIFVDAHTGQILYKNPIIKHANGLISDKQTAAYSEKIEMLTTGNAATRYNGARNIEAKLVGANYVLSDDTRGNGIVTYNSGQTTTYPSTNFTDSDNDWSDGNYAADHISEDNAALDAHWGAEMTYDFWKNIFNRNSYDDNGAKIKSYVHYNVNYDNAFWNGSAMSYGDGSSMSILTALDVCGHEIGHAVCSNTAALAYQNQSGGINEGYSDIWGACVEQYSLTGTLDGTPRTGNGTTITNGFDYNLNVWLIGEDITGGSGLRSMRSPRTKQNPDTYLGQYWTATGDEGSCVPDNTSANTNDHCGVHGNSGVLNHWFYILTAGKASNNTQITPNYSYFVNGIGMAKSSEIAFLLERDYLTANSTFADAREASLTVAGSLYCIASPEYKSVVDAWYAVNVGPKYVGAPDDVNLKSITNSASVACNAASSPSIVFENAGTNPITSVTITYNIDGGADTVETWTGNLDVCSTGQNYSLTVSGLTRGAHTLTVTTTVTNDGVATNNTKTANITVNDSGLVNVVNPFDATTDALVSFDDTTGLNTVWERGTSTKTKLTDAVAGGSQVYATKLSGTYPDKTKAFLVSQCYDLTFTANPVLKFDMAYDLEKDWDILYMEYSTDGTTWSVLGTGTSATWYTNNRMPNGTDCFNCIGGQWTGEAAGTHPNGGVNAVMRPYSYDLSAFGLGGATPQSNMIFRFVFLSDEAEVRDGAIIDNFVVEGTLGTVENSFNTFAVSPNPSKGTVLLSLSAGSDVKVNLFDIMGRNIYSKTYSNAGNIFNQELQFNNLSKGIYLLNVESDGKKGSKKLIIE